MQNKNHVSHDKHKNKNIFQEEIISPKCRFNEFNEEWHQSRLDKICFIQDGTHTTPIYTDEGVPFFSVETITSNAPPKFISKEEHKKLIKRCKPKINDILLTRIGTLAKSKLVDWDYEFSIYVSLALLSDIQINSEFLNQYLQTNYYKKDFLRKSLLLAVPQKINLKDLKETKIKHPSIEEQKKIANFLKLVDKKIILMQKKHKNIENFKNEFFNDYVSKLQNNNYKKFKLDELISIQNKRNKNNENISVLSVNNKLGFISQEEQFEDRIVASSDTKNYKIVEKGDFAYNPARINVGSIARLTNFDKGIISPMYIVFKTDDNLINPIFFENYISTNYFKLEILKRLEGSVRLILSADSLKNIEISIPNLNEQQIISGFLDSLSKDIYQSEIYLKKLKEFKKGLLQKMFV